MVNEDGTTTLVGCWSSAGSAADSESGFLTPDYDWIATADLAKTQEQWDEIIRECGSANYRDDGRCCRITFIEDAKGNVTKFIKAEAIK